MVTTDTAFPGIEFDGLETAAALQASPESAYSQRLLELTSESDELQADLDALDESMTWMRAELRSLRAAPPAPAAAPALPGFFSVVLDWRTAAAFFGCFALGLVVFS